MIQEKLAEFEETLKSAQTSLDTLAKEIQTIDELDEEKRKGFTDALTELNDLLKLYDADRKRLIAEIEKFLSRHSREGGNPENNWIPGQARNDKHVAQINAKQHSVRKAFEPAVEHIRGVIKQVDLLYKLVSRIGDIAHELASVPNIPPRPLGEGRGEGLYDRRTVGRLIKQLDEERKDAVDQLKQTTNFYKQIFWLQERFPDAELRDVPGLVKLVDKADIEAADWSLTPG